jgi:alkylation response protein AidB-like acyl-CoA dehydrogenase
MTGETTLDFELSDDLKAVRNLARDFAENEIHPVVLHHDETQEFPHEIFRKLGELGLLGILVPPEYGGAGMGMQEYAVIVEEIARVCPSIALGVAAHNGLCSGHILRFGSEEIKQKYLPRLASGETMGAWGLTEPGSGSDAGGMITTAVRDGDYYIINGAKNFITHGNVGDIAVVMAVTGEGKRGISAFAIDKSMPGFAATKKENKVGMRCSDTASLVFDNVRVPASHMLGVEGEGFIQALQILDGGRISIAALSVGLAQGALDASLKYAAERKQFGKPLAQMQAIQFKLADMATNVEAGRALTYRAAWMRDNGHNYSLAASQAKLFSSEMCVRAAEDAVQIHGGYGYIKEYPVEKLWRDSKLLTIGEGTSEVQRTVIARAVLGEA